MTIETFSIPELDNAASRYKSRAWTDDQVALLIKYWRCVPKAMLAKHVRHGRDAIADKAAEIGLPEW